MSHATSRPGTLTSNKKTLDIQHNNKLHEFQEAAEKHEQLREQLSSLQLNISELEKKRKNEQLTSEEYDLYISYVDERDKVKKQLEHIEQHEDELEYLVNTGSILFKYYDIVEKGNGDEQSSTPKITSNSILKYFVKKDETKEEVKPVEAGQDRASLLESYMSYVDENFIKPTNNEVSDTCESCGSSNRNVLLNDGIVYCNECCSVEYIIVDHDRPSYKDPPREISYFAYKRKRIDALKSHMPKISEKCLWENICVLRLAMYMLRYQWLVLQTAMQHTLMREVPESLQYHSLMETWLRNTVNSRLQW